MANQAQTFRIFVSSTFSDLKAERNALQAKVFPKLEEYCTKRGATFQAIDLRWGVSQEASHDQQTLDICLNEVRRCQAITPRPNFIVLLGNRYGWCPPPAKIPIDEFEPIKQKTRLFDRLLLNHWYKQDKNALDPVYVLQPWDKLTYDEWADIETKLHTILLKGAEKANLPSDSQLKYWASATHQEILTGTFGDLAQPEHVFAFFREINPPPPVEEAEEYLDLVEINGKLQVDQKAQNKLSKLKNKLINKLGRQNVLEYNTSWKDHAPEQNHIKQLCQDVLEKLMVAIGAQLDQLEAKDDLDQELAAQMEFAEERRAYFIGREDSLKSISEYLSQRAADPMIIWGDSGTGKSALMAQALVKSKSCFPKALLIFRFAGSTPESTSSDLLPVSICHQINRAYDVDEVIPPVGDPGFIAAFEERLALANSNQPIIIFIDALDQIKGNIKWLPKALPPYVHLVVSTTPGSIKEKLDSQLPNSAFLKLKPLPDKDANDLLDRWLKEDAKRTLSKEQREMVLQNKKPLYLKLAYTEARRWHSYDSVPRLNKTIQGLISDLLTRISSSEQHGEPLVSRILGFLAAAKNGLTEDEVLRLLSRDKEVYKWFLKSLFHLPSDLLSWVQEFMKTNEIEAETWLKITIENETELDAFINILQRENPDLKIPIVLWSRLYSDLEPYLSHQHGDGTLLFRFYHPTSFGEAVRKRYLSQERHKDLAIFFESLPLTLEGGPNLRKLSELPFQQTMAGMWPEVVQTLTNLDFLQAKVDTAGPSSLLEDIDRVFDMGHVDPALKLLRKAINLSLHQLHSESDQLPSQLYGRLKGVELPHIQDLIAQIKEIDRPWLKTLSYCLHHAISSIQQTMPVRGEILKMAISSNERWLAITNSDSMLDVWDLKTGVLSYHKDFEFNYLGNDDDVAISSDGRYFLNIAQPSYIHPPYTPYRHETIRIWDLETDEEIRPIRGEVDGLGYSIDKESNYIIEEWPKRHTQKEENWIEAKIPGKAHPLRLVFGEFSSSDYVNTSAGLEVIYKDGEGSVSLFDSSFKGKTPTMAKHKSNYKSSLNKLIISSDGLLAASIADYDDIVVKLWSLKTGAELISFQAVPNGKFKFDPTGKSLMCVQANSVSLWNALSGEKIWHRDRNVKGGVKEFFISPDGQKIIISNRYLGVTILDLETGEEKPLFPSKDYGILWSIALTQDGRKAAVNPFKQNIQVWDLKTDLILQEFEGTKDRVWRALAITPDGSRVIAGGQNILFAWDTNSGDVLLHQESIKVGFGFEHLSISPCGHRAVSAGDDHKLAVWNLHTGSKITSLTGEYEFTCVAISEDGTKIAAGDSGGIVYLLKLENIPKLSGFRKSTQAHELPNETPEPKHTSGEIWEDPRIWQKLQEHNKLNKNGQFDEALEIIDDLLEEFPDNSALLTFKSSVLTSLKRHKEVVNITSQLLERNDVPQAVIGILYLSHGVAKSELGDTLTGLEFLEKGLPFNDSEELRWEIGSLQLKIARFSDAEVTFNELIQRDNKNLQAVFGYAIALINLGREKEACPYLQQFLDGEGPYVEYYTDLARELLNKNCE